MRHNRNDKRFNRKSGHLRCMMANMTSDLLNHERIKTTTPKAKELRRYTERMITLGKDGSLHARRRAFAFLGSKSVVTKLFADIAPRFTERKGGYTRVLKIGNRPGDCAPMSIIELVEGPKVSPSVDATKISKKGAEPKEDKSAKGRVKAAAEAVKKAVQKENAPKKATSKKPAAKKKEADSKSKAKETAAKKKTAEPAKKAAAKKKAAPKKKDD